MLMNRAIILISEEEREWIKHVLYLEPWLEDNLNQATKIGNRYHIPFLHRDEVFDCVSAVMFHNDSHGKIWDISAFVERMQQICLNL